MQVTVNGEPTAVEAATLAELLGALDLGDATVATAVNGDFVPARLRAETPVSAGDRVEIVAPMQGG